MPDVKAVLWDVGGTLVCRTMDGATLLRRALQQAGVDPARIAAEDAERARALYRSEEPSWRTLADERAGRLRVARALCGEEVADDAVERLAGALGRYYEGYRVVDGIPELLGRVAGAGLKQGIVSNWPPSLRDVLRHLELDAHFDPIVVSGEEGVAKPDSELMERALRQLRLKPRDALFVGNDPQVDIAPARTLGMQAVHFDPERRGEEADARTSRELLRLLARRGVVDGAGGPAH